MTCLMPHTATLNYTRERSLAVFTVSSQKRAYELVYSRDKGNYYGGP